MCLGPKCGLMSHPCFYLYRTASHLLCESSHIHFLETVCTAYTYTSPDQDVYLYVLYTLMRSPVEVPLIHYFILHCVITC
jgi:hypothetical protein